MQVFSTDAAFAVLRAAGEVFCWGDALYGGCCGDVKVRPAAHRFWMFGNLFF